MAYLHIPNISIISLLIYYSTTKKIKRQQFAVKLAQLDQSSNKQIRRLTYRKHKLLASPTEMQKKCCEQSRAKCEGKKTKTK